MPPNTPSPLPDSPKIPSNAHLTHHHESSLNTSEVATMASLPPSPSKALHSPPDTMDSSAPTEKQGMPEPAAAKKTTPGRKRKAATTSSGDDTGAEPAAKRKRATAAPPKKPAAKKRSPKTPKIVVEDLDSGRDIKVKAEKSLAPLARAVKSKIQAVDAFLDTHTSPLIEREEGSNIVVMDELDLLAALIILRVDYQVENSSTEVSLEDAGDMVVARLDAGKVSVDLDKTCDTERAVQAKLAPRGTELEDVNLVEVEIEMLVAKRKQLVEDEEADAGFREYGERTGEGETGGYPPRSEIVRKKGLPSRFSTWDM